MSNIVIDSAKEKYGAVAQNSLSRNDRGVKAVAEVFGTRAETAETRPGGWPAPQSLRL